MSGKPIKEMIISTMQNGPETLKELEMAKKTGKDISLERGTVQRKVDGQRDRTGQPHREADPAGIRHRISAAL